MRYHHRKWLRIGMRIESPWYQIVGQAWKNMTMLMINNLCTYDINIGLFLSFACIHHVYGPSPKSKSTEAIFENDYSQFICNAMACSHHDILINKLILQNPSYQIVEQALSNITVPYPCTYEINICLLFFPNCIYHVYVRSP